MQNAKVKMQKFHFFTYAMRKIILSIIIIFLISDVFAQSYFNKRFGFVNSYNLDRSNALLEVDSGYVVGGWFNWENNGSIYLGLAKFDYIGNFLWTKNIGEQGKQYWLGFPGSLIKTSDNGYLLCGTYKDIDTIIDGGLLMKLDCNFDTLWTKIIRDTITPSNDLYYFLNCIEVGNDEFVIVGIKMPYGEVSRIYLVKMDHLGNLIWEHEYGTGNYMYQAFSVIQTSDNGFAIGGYRFIIGHNDSADPIIYKTDSMGNLQWQKNIGGNCFDYHPVLTLSQDGNIIAGITHCDSMVSPDYSYSSINILEIDNNSNIVFNKNYGAEFIDNVILQIHTVDSSGYIAIGTVVNDYPHYSGWVIKVDKNGDSTWYRQYDHLYGAESENYLFDIISTNDKGYICSGYVNPYPPDVGSQDAWILKLDSLGCDTPGCDPTVSIINHKPLKSNGLSIYPNPPENELFLQWNPDKPNGIAIVEFYDVYGRKVYSEFIKSTKTCRIDVSGWQEGVYVAVVRENDTIIGKEKLMVHKKNK